MAERLVPAAAEGRRAAVRGRVDGGPFVGLLPFEAVTVAEERYPPGRDLPVRSRSRWGSAGCASCSGCRRTSRRRRSTSFSDSRWTTERLPSNPVVPGRTTFVTPFGLMCEHVYASWMTSSNGTVVCTFRMPDAIHVNNALWSAWNCLRNCASDAISTRPPFSCRAKSPPLRLCRSRENASTCLPSSVCTPGSKSESGERVLHRERDVDREAAEVVVELRHAPERGQRVVVDRQTGDALHRLDQQVGTAGDERGVDLARAAPRGSPPRSRAGCR